MSRLVLLASAALFAVVAEAAGLDVSSGWIRLLPAGVPAAGYFELHNRTNVPVQLVAASSPAFGTVMLHRSVEEKGRSSMVHLDEITVPASGRIVFKPGDYHLMLVEPSRKLRVGEKISITFEFASGEKVTAQFEVRGPSGR